MKHEMLQVEEIYAIVDQGITVPIKCRLTGDIEAYVKYPNNPCGNTVLINEYIGSSIAQKAGIKGCEFGVCELSVSTIEMFSRGEEDLDDSNSGVCFFTVAMSKLVPKVLWHRVDPLDSAKIVLLDHILINLDRHEGNALFDMNKGQLIAIDYSHILGTRNGNFPNPNSELTIAGMDEDRYLFKDVLENNAEVYDGLFSFGGCSENAIWQAAESIKESLTGDFIIRLMKSIPEEWKSFVESDTIKRLTDLLYFRINHIDRIAEMIIQERR